MTDATDSAKYGAPPLATSAALAWQGVRVKHYRLGLVTLPAHHYPRHLLLLYQSSDPTTIRRQHGSRVEQQQFRAGDLSLCPSGEYGAGAGNATLDAIHLCIDDAHLAQVARQGLDLAHFRLRDEFRFEDPFLTQLGRQLLAAAGNRLLR